MGWAAGQQSATGSCNCIEAAHSRSPRSCCHGRCVLQPCLSINKQPSSLGLAVRLLNLAVVHVAVVCRLASPIQLQGQGQTQSKGGMENGMEND